MLFHFSLKYKDEEIKEIMELNLKGGIMLSYGYLIYKKIKLILIILSLLIIYIKYEGTQVNEDKKEDEVPSDLSSILKYMKVKFPPCVIFTYLCM